MRWTVTEADRDSDGRIWITPPARTLADLLPKPEGEEEKPRKPWRPGRLELAGIAAGLVLAGALIAGLNAFWPAAPAPIVRPTQAPAPTAAPTLAPSPTIATQAAYAAPGGALLGTIPQTATLAYQHSGYPGWAGVAHDSGIVWVETNAPIASLPDLAPPPTLRPAPPRPAPAAAPVEACDPLVNPRYTAPRQVDPIGSVIGVSCTSQAEAEANADALAAAMLATADAPERPASNAR